MRNRKLLITLIAIAIIVWALFALSANQNQDKTYKNGIPSSEESAIKAEAQPTIETINKELETNSSYTFDIPADFKIEDESTLPKFITIKNNKVEVSTTKYDSGTYAFNLNNDGLKSINYSLRVTSPKSDFEALEAQIKAFLGDKLDKYTIHLENLLNEQRIDINQGKIVEPASIAKLPVAVLIMRDVDAGKITLEDTYPLKNSEKFGTIGNLGSLPDGYKVSFRRYLEELLKHSDNNAWYALVNYLGKSYQVVNPRIINELGVNPLFLDPAQGTAQGVGKILKDIYFANTLKRESADYLISLLEDADEWARAAIGLGLPNGTRFINKIGTLNDSGKVSYQDGAIVWGEKTDYVLVIMDEYIGWSEGQETIKEISKMVYEYLN